MSVETQPKLTSFCNFPQATPTGIPGQDFMRREDLRVGEYYYGYCRNSSCARWDGNNFIYVRTKFGSKFDEEINYPTEEIKFDVFIPLYRCYPTIEEVVQSRGNLEQPTFGERS